MLSLTEFSKVLDLSKERTKQIVDLTLLSNPSLHIDKENKWLISPELAEEILKNRGKELPKNLVITLKASKGGVGGTSLMFEVATYFSKFMKVLCIDADPEAHLSNLLYQDSIDYKKIRTLYEVFSENASLDTAIMKTKYPNLDLLPSSLRLHKVEKVLQGQNPKKIMRAKIDELKSEYNLIFIDLSPSLASNLVISSYLSADRIFLPVIPNTFSLESVALTKDTIERLCEEFDVLPKNFKIIFNQYSQKTIASQEILSVLLQEYKALVLPTYVNQSSAITNSINAGQSIFDIKGSKDVKENFENLALSMLDWIE